MQEAMQPLETWWQGTRFRSRLEARWAVCFAALGIPWEYEPQGYALPNGPYLPDFRLWGCLYAEVKPVPTPVTEWEMYEELIEKTRGMNQLLVLVGQPRVTWYPVITVAPYAVAWIDLDRCSLEQGPRLHVSEKKPPKEDLAWPHLRFEKATLAAAFERFEHKKTRRMA
jgi:hypothetical protein